MSVWFDAAARIATDEESFGRTDLTAYACHAIKSATRGTGCRDVTLQSFDRWFRDEGTDARGPWWACPCETDADQEARRLALCFMHWISLTEGEQ